MFMRIICIYVNTVMLKVTREIKKYNINSNEGKVSIAILISDTVTYICKEEHNNGKMYILSGRYENLKFVST